MIRDWEAAIGLSNAMEIRQFAIMVKKPGISIYQCVQGFRMLQLLKHLGIGKNSELDNLDYDDAKEISTFIQVVHRIVKSNV
jgi:hypothetical protein